MKAFAVAGLGFGDEGKGSVVDALAEKFGAGLVVRYNGGAQAAHNVVRAGKHHTFAQFGSASLIGARTHLSRFMVVNPKTLHVEAENLHDLGVVCPHQLLSVDPCALVTTPYHMLANRLREDRRGSEAHGTTGMGVGETVEFAKKFGGLALRVQDLYEPMECRKVLDDIRAAYLAEIEEQKLEGDQVPAFYHPGTFERAMESFQKFAASVMVREDDDLVGMMERAKVTIFEGAQGMLLDEQFGFHPYSTWSDCTFDNVLDLIDSFDVDLIRLGVLRAYHTRHGAGPLPTERDDYVRVTAGDHNVHSGNPYQGRFRAGPFDFVLARYAAKTVGKLDGLAITHLDALPAEGLTAYSSYYWVTNEERTVEDILGIPSEEIASLLNRVEPRFVNVPGRTFATHISKRLEVPLFMTSKGLTSADKEFLT